MPVKPNNKISLVKEVETLLNNKYCKYSSYAKLKFNAVSFTALSVNDPMSHVPYSSMAERNVLLNGKPLLLKNPCVMTIEELNHIKANISCLHFKGKVAIIFLIITFGILI